MRHFTQSAAWYVVRILYVLLTALTMIGDTDLSCTVLCKYCVMRGMMLICAVLCWVVLCHVMLYVTPEIWASQP